jgi:hypothetical protein
MQKRQPTAQPTWVETHRPSRGSRTLSTDQQALGIVLADMLGMEARQAVEIGGEGGQGGADGQWQEILRPAAAGAVIQRARLGPGPQDAFLVASLGAEGAQALADVFDAHGGGEC